MHSVAPIIIDGIKIFFNDFFQQPVTPAEFQIDFSVFYLSGRSRCDRIVKKYAGG